jgi:hypothetical protein
MESKSEICFDFSSFDLQIIAFVERWDGCKQQRSFYSVLSEKVCFCMYELHCGKRARERVKLES